MQGRPESTGLLMACLRCGVAPHCVKMSSSLGLVLALTGLLSAGPVLADNSNLSEHDRYIHDESERNTRYHNNADDYPAPSSTPTPVLAPPPEVRQQPYESGFRSDVEAAVERAQPGIRREFEEGYAKAQKGDIDAILDLARHYATGYGTTVDPLSAFRTYLSIADREPIAAFNVGLILYEGRTGVDRDRRAAYAWIKQAVAAGDADAAKWLSYHPEPVDVQHEFPIMTSYSDDLYQQDGADVKPVTAEETDKIIAKIDKGESFFNSMAKLAPIALNAGKANLHGIGVPVNFDRADKLLSFAKKEQEDEESDSYLTIRAATISDLWLWWMRTPQDPAILDHFGAYVRHFDGIGSTPEVPVDSYFKALWACAANQPDIQREGLEGAAVRIPVAATALAVMLLEGDGGKRDEARGITLLTKAAESDRNAQYILGLLYENGGHGVVKDIARAAVLFQLASAKGHVTAAEHLKKIAANP